MSSGGNILVVCTGNVCRSPYIERLLAARLPGAGVVVSSAGTHALVDAEMAPEAAVRLAREGGEFHNFRARQLTPRMVDEADVVLTATRRHRSAVVQLDPRALRRTFTVSDFSDLVDGVEPVTVGATDETVMRRLAALAMSRRAEVAPRAPDDVDIVDPWGQPARVYEEMAAHIGRLVPPIVGTVRAWTSAQPD